MEERVIDKRLGKPHEQDYKEYVRSVNSYNKRLQKAVRETLHEIVNTCANNNTILTTGSDGRLEKGPVSPIEIIVLKKEEDDIDHTFEEMNNYISTYKLKVFDEQFEIKNVDQQPTSHYILPNGNKLVSPNRFLDSTYLCGNEQLLLETTKKFIEEIKSPFGKKIVKEIKDRARLHRKTTITGKQQYRGEEITHYEQGVTTYDPEKGLWSFKQGPLRATQYAFVRDSLRFIRQHPEGENILQLPHNTIEKITRLKEQNLLAISTSMADDLIDNYSFFLWNYLTSQYEHHFNNNNHTTYDKKEVEERLASIEQITAEQLIKF